MLPEFQFNNSVAKYDSVYLVPYRAIYTTIKGEHPWHFWCGGERFYKTLNIKQLHQTFVHPRYQLEGARIVSFDNKAPDDSYYDTTNLIITDKLGDRNIADIQNILNGGVDARIVRVKDKYYLTYNINTVIADQSYRYTTAMVYRTIDIDLTSRFIYLSAEQFMFPHKRLVDKNCVFDEDGRLIYSLVGGIQFIPSPIGPARDDIACPIMRMIESHYKYIVFSPGSAPVYWRCKYIGVGHVKFEYYKLLEHPKMRQFVHGLNWHGVKLHGRYIYMNFFYQYDLDKNTCELSAAFIIPHRGRWRYYLNVACGLLADNDLMITYGNGDVSMHYTMMGDKIDSLFSPFDHTYDFRIITKYILIYGYYNRQNTGDDAFMEVFKWLYRDRTEHLVFCSPEDEIPALKYEYIILGGGDVLNNYFIEPLIKHFPNHKIYALGVGMPYLVENLDIFTRIVARNRNFFGRDQEYYPDLAFLLQYITNIAPSLVINQSNYTAANMIISAPANSVRPTSRRMKIGVALPRTWYNPEYVAEYTTFCEQLAYAFSCIIFLEDADLYFIPFCFNENERDADFYADLKYHVDKHVMNRFHLVEFAKSDPLNSHYVYETLEYINYMDFMICGRFHSHVFSMIHHKPFISLSCSRKCQLLMEETGMPIHQIRTNHQDVPIAINKSFVDECRDAITAAKICTRFDGLPLPTFI